MEFKRLIKSKNIILCLLILVIISCGFFINEQAKYSAYGLDTYNNFKRDTIELYEDCTNEQVIRSLANRIERMDVYSNLGMYSSMRISDPQYYAEEGAEEELEFRKLYPYLCSIYDEAPWKHDSMKYGMVNTVIRDVNDQATYINTYDEYIQNIKDQADKMSSVSIFSKANSFSMRNIEKTLKAYEGLEGLELKLGIDEPITSVMRYQLVHYLMLIFIILLVTQLLSERKQGLWSIVHAAASGREKLAARRLGILAVMVAGAEAIMYISLFAAAFMIYGGFDDIFRNVQSMQFFQNFTIVMPVWLFIIVYIAVNIVTGILLAYFIWLIMSVISNNILAFATIGIVGAVEYVLYTFVPIQSNFSVFKCVNLFAFINPTDTLITYRNLNLFSLAVNRRIMCEIVLVVMLIAVSVVCVIVNARKKPVQSPGRFEIFVVKVADSIISWYRGLIERLPAVGFELYKLLILQKGILVIIVLGWYLLSTINTNTIIYGRTGTLLNEFYENYSGAPGVAVNRYLESLDEEIQEVTSEYEDAKEQYKNGEITYSEFEAVSMKINAYSTKMDVYAIISDKMIYLDMLRSGRGINGWLLNDNGYNSLFGEHSDNLNNRHSLIAIFALVLTLSGILSFERKSQTMKLVRSVYGGRFVLFKRKLAAASIVTVLIWAVVYGIEIYNVCQLYGLHCFGAPVQSLSYMYGFPLKISIGMFMFMVYMLRLLQLFAVTGVVFAISAVCNYEVSLMVSAAACVVPAALYLMNISAFKYLCIIEPVSMIELIKSYPGMLWLLPVMFVILLGAAGYILSAYNWCVTGRVKNA